MDIIFILSRDPESPGGGVRTFVKNIAEMLFKRPDVKVRIVSPQTYEKSLFERIPIGKNIQSNISFMFRLILKTPFIKTNENTIIYGQRADFVFPFVLFRKKGKRGVHIHGQQFEGVNERGKTLGFLFYAIEKYTLKRVNFIFFTDRITYNAYREMYGDIIFKDKEVKIIPVGVDTTIFKPLPQNECRRELNLPLNFSIVVSVARLNKEKRFDILLKAFKILKEKRKNTMLVIVGDGPELPNLKELAHKLGINNDVLFPGLKDRKEIPIYLNAADLFVLSSDREGSPNSVKEAMACGIPVVATEVGDIKDIIRDKGIGLVVKPGDYLALASAMDEALDIDWNREAIVKYAQQFTWENIATEMIKVYENLLISE